MSVLKSESLSSVILFFPRLVSQHWVRLILHLLVVSRIHVVLINCRSFIRLMQIECFLHLVLNLLFLDLLGLPIVSVSAFTSCSLSAMPVLFIRAKVTVDSQFL